MQEKTRTQVLYLFKISPNSSKLSQTIQEDRSLQDAKSKKNHTPTIEHPNFPFTVQFNLPIPLKDFKKKKFKKKELTICRIKQKQQTNQANTQNDDARRSRTFHFLRHFSKTSQKSKKNAKKNRKIEEKGAPQMQN